MSKPAASATEVDEDLEQEEETDADGSETENDEETDETKPDAGDDADPDGETADREDGENSDGDEDADGEADGEADDVDPRDGEIASLKQELAAINEKLGKAPAATPAAPAEPTEQQWQTWEEQYGIPKSAIKLIAGQTASLRKEMTDVIGKILDERLGVYEKDSTMERLAREKGLSDITKYRPGIDEFLKEFSPAFHKDPVLLEKAYYYAKGKGTKDMVRKASNANERHKRIITNRPSQPSSGGKSGGNVRLTREEEAARRAFGMSTNEFMKYRRKK